MAIAYLNAEVTGLEVVLRFESNTEKRNGERWATDIELIEVETHGETYDRAEFTQEFGVELWDRLETMHMDVSDWEE